MAEESEKPKKKRILKKTESVRERAEKAATRPDKPRKLRSTVSKAGVPLKAVARVGRMEYYLPLPDNKIGRFLNKRRRVMPKFFREAWSELRQVIWPTRRETWKLTLAVFIFAIAFGLIIALTDYGLDKLFRKLLLQ